MITENTFDMAFGTFFKNIINGAKKVFSTVAPYIRKAIDIAPVIGNAIGGKVGNAINKVSNVGSKMLGSNGSGQWKLPNSGIRFGTPALKYG